MVFSTPTWTILPSIQNMLEKRKFRLRCLLTVHGEIIHDDNLLLFYLIPYVKYEITKMPLPLQILSVLVLVWVKIAQILAEHFLQGLRANCRVLSSCPTELEKQGPDILLFVGRWPLQSLNIVRILSFSIDLLFKAKVSQEFRANVF